MGMPDAGKHEVLGRGLFSVGGPESEKMRQH